jgi:hypothetical protein
MFKVPETPWYEDGIEGGEQCWRLDVTPHVQLQLFAKTDLDDDDDDSNPEYHTPRLFWEKDLREPGNPDNRIYYACDSMTITEAEALALLSLGEDAARTHLADLLAELDNKPNDPQYNGTIAEQWSKLIPA